MTQSQPQRSTPPGVHPPNDYPPYRSTALRAPRQAAIAISPTLSEHSGPAHADGPGQGSELDLTRQHAGEPIGERIIVEGRLLDEGGRPIPHALLEIWQCNAAGRYLHKNENRDAPLDPNFSGAGRMLSDAQGRYRLITIKPGAYPWGNHSNAWRPAHVHFSVFGASFLTRLITQMYFPGDPLLALDPIFNSIPDARARHRLVAGFDLEVTRPDRGLGYRFDLVLRGRDATPFEG